MFDLITFKSCIQSKQFLQSKPLQYFPYIFKKEVNQLNILCATYTHITWLEDKQKPFIHDYKNTQLYNGFHSPRDQRCAYEG